MEVRDEFLVVTRRFIGRRELRVSCPFVTGIEAPGSFVVLQCDLLNAQTRVARNYLFYTSYSNKDTNNRP